MNRSKQGTLRDAYFLFLFFFHIFFSLVCCCCIHYSSYSYGQISFITQFILSVCVCLCVHYTLFYEIGFFFGFSSTDSTSVIFTTACRTIVIFKYWKATMSICVCVIDVQMGILSQEKKIRWIFAPDRIQTHTHASIICYLHYWRFFSVIGSIVTIWWLCSWNENGDNHHHHDDNHNDCSSYIEIVIVDSIQ